MDINFDFLNSKEFFNLMQSYRNVTVCSQNGAIDIYYEVKKYIKSQIYQQVNPTETDTDISTDYKCEECELSLPVGTPFIMLKMWSDNRFGGKWFQEKVLCCGCHEKLKLKAKENDKPT